jgi:alkylation response protein AidB-like acyl-CoA dehydrogenase
MSSFSDGSDPLLEVAAYADAFEQWLGPRLDAVQVVSAPIRHYGERVEAMRDLMKVLYGAGWARYGWPTQLGGLGGDITHRAAMWEALARHGVQGMALFEHLEVLGPTLAELGPPELIAELLPAYLEGRELWAQGFSEPGAGSDLASLRTAAKASDDGFVVNGRKIWTSWARYATWCLLLARTGTTASRHRGLTAMVVDLRHPGVEVRPIEGANGTDELAEVAFDDVFVPGDRVVGEVGGGWAVAMHILGHERGTFAWFRQCFLHQHLRHVLPGADPANDAALGDAVLDLAAAAAAGRRMVRADAAGRTLGPDATFSKLALCSAERSVNDWVLAERPDIALDVTSDEASVLREEYLFSRIVTVYGGSQQMQLETIAKQVLRLP